MSEKIDKRDCLQVNEKFLLTIREASDYFNIGIKNMRRIAENNEGSFAMQYGNKFLLCRPRLEEYFLGMMSAVETENDESNE